jgi:hypothetical protein
VRQAADAYLASETGKADTKGLSPQEAKVLAVEESLAEMAEATDLSGSALRQLGNFFARLADRFGMPNLARAIRTMGLDPLQAFIREAIQAGIRPSVGEGVTRFRPGAPAFDRWFGDSKVVNAKGKPKVMYHGTARDVTGFRAKQAGAIFVTEDPRFAAGFSEMSQSWMLNNYRSILTDKQIEAARNAVPRILEQEGYKGAEAASLQRQIDNNAPTGAAQAIWEAALKEQMPTGPNVMPLYVKAENPFDYQNENHLARLRAWDYQNRYISIPGSRNQVINTVNVGNGGWSSIEDPRTQKAIRDLGFDGFYVKEGGLKNLAVYSPTQIKSATGNVGAYGQRPITKKEAERFGMTEEQAAEAQAAGDVRFRTKAKPKATGLVGEPEKATAGDILGRTVGDRKTIGFRAQTTDSLAGVEAELGEAYAERVSDQMGNKNPVVLLSRALDSPRFAAEMLNVGTMVVDPSGMTRLTELDYNGQNISYASVMRDVAAEAKQRGLSGEVFVKQFGEVLAGRREYELMQDPESKGLDFFLTPEQAEAANDRFNNDAFIKDAAAKLDAIRFAGIDLLVGTERITPDKAKEWKDATAYTPFKRIDKMDKEAVAQGQGGMSSDLKLAAFREMKAFKGSKERQTINPLENFVDLMEWMVRESMKNEAVRRALGDMDLIGAAKRVPNPQTVPNNQKGALVSAYEKGQQKFYLVPDPANLAAFTGFKAGSTIFPVRAMQKFSQVLRVGVTATPPFAVKQIFDDITRLYVHSGVENPAALVPRMLLNFPRAWWAEIRGLRTPGMEMLARHGVVPTYDTIEGGNVRNIFEETGISKRSIGKAILRIMEAGAKASDISARQAIFDQTMKETGDADLAEQRAREIINFSRKGASATADTLIRVVPFFNAYARSMDKLLLAAAGNPAMQKTLGMSTGYARNLFFKRMGVLTAMGLSYALLMWDDEEYQALSDTVRDRNWVLPYGKELGFTPAIPLPGELAFFFKAIPERVVQYVKLQGTPEERDALRVAKEMMLAGIDLFWTPNLTPQMVKPFVENLANYSFFLGRPLESQAQQQLDPSKRFGTGTSEAVKAGAEALSEAGIELSPIKIENAIRGVFGMSAGIALSVADALVNPSRTDRPLHQQIIPQLTGASALMKDPVGNRFLDDIYDLDKKVEQCVQHVQEGRER